MFCVGVPLSVLSGITQLLRFRATMKIECNLWLLRNVENLQIFANCFSFLFFTIITGWHNTTYIICSRRPYNMCTGTFGTRSRSK